MSSMNLRLMGSLPLVAAPMALRRVQDGTALGGLGQRDLVLDGALTTRGAGGLDGDGVEHARSTRLCSPAKPPASKNKSGEAVWFRPRPRSGEVTTPPPYRASFPNPSPGEGACTPHWLSSARLLLEPSVTSPLFSARVTSEGLRFALHVAVTRRGTACAYAGTEFPNGGP